MEIVNQLKAMNIDIAWTDTEEGVIGKSIPIVRHPFKFEEELMIMEGDNDIYLRFTCDENNYFWIPVADKTNFLHLYDIYTKTSRIKYENQK